MNILLIFICDTENICLTPSNGVLIVELLLLFLVSNLGTHCETWIQLIHIMNYLFSFSFLFPFQVREWIKRTIFKVSKIVSTFLLKRVYISFEKKGKNEVRESLWEEYTQRLNRCKHWALPLFRCGISLESINWELETQTGEYGQ